MVTTSPPTRTYHLLAAFFGAAKFLLPVRLLPSLKTAGNQLVIIVEAAAALAILNVVTRAGDQTPESFGIRKVRPATLALQR